MHFSCLEGGGGGVGGNFHWTESVNATHWKERNKDVCAFVLLNIFVAKRFICCCYKQFFCCQSNKNPFDLDKSKSPAVKIAAFLPF